MREIAPGIIVGAWFTFLAIWLISALTTKRAVKRFSGPSRTVQVVLMFVAYFLLFDPQTAVGFLDWRFISRSDASTWTGIGMTLAGLLFAVWARIFIGRNWSSAITVKQDHQLIRTGPYAIVRHPIYAGLLVAILGTAIAIDEVRGLIAVALATVSFWMKSQVEERFMTEQFGAEYASYKRDVKALVPFIW
jgi:protein-S-isoprenylcysteine O-methyltransferase Ste14